MRVYLGGTLFEAFVSRGMVKDYRKLVDQLGLDLVEVSDGSISMPAKEKCKYITDLAKHYTVLSEVVSKESGILISPAKWVRMMRTELDAGSWKVIAEARESGTVGIYRPSGHAHTALVNRILAKIEAKDILWEAPQKSQQVWFIKQLGADAILAEVEGSTYGIGEQALIELRVVDPDGEVVPLGLSVEVRVTDEDLAGAVDGAEFTVASDAGIKTLTLERHAAPTRHTLRVDLGAVVVGAVADEWAAGSVTHAQWVDVGNPHLVLAVPDHEAVDLVDAGRRVDAEVPGGANVETIVVGAGDEVSMRVFERGVGLTDACGTGACASAAAAHAWGMVGTKVLVHQPGGDATVELGSTTHNTVEVEAIARVEWPWA